MDDIKKHGLLGPGEKALDASPNGEAPGSPQTEGPKINKQHADSRLAAPPSKRQTATVTWLPVDRSKFDGSRRWNASRVMAGERGLVLQIGPFRGRDGVYVHRGQRLDCVFRDGLEAHELSALGSFLMALARVTDSRR